MFALPVRLVRRGAAAVVCVALLAGTAACTGKAEPPVAAPSPSPDASTGTAPTLDAKPVPMQVRVTRVSGKLKRSSQKSLERSVARTIGSYFDAAYLGGPYPRDDFSNAFGTFTAGAAEKARRSQQFLTNASLGPSTKAVAPREKKAWLSVLAPNKVAAGVTARIRLVYDVDRGEDPDTRVTVSGRLLLTRKQSGGWQIFGYDVARSARPTENGGS